MLVLTRKLQEQIHIGDNIVLTVLRIKGNTVRVGVEAPRDVRILRGELPRKEEREVAELVINSESNDAFTTDDPASSDSGPAEETIGESEALQLVHLASDSSNLVAGAV